MNSGSTVENMITIEAIPAFQDNYIWMISNMANQNAVVVDPGEAGPVLDALTRTGLTLTGILVTHHHPDHIGGIPALLKEFPVPVYGPTNPKITTITHRISEGETLHLSTLDITFSIIETPGHTLDHIAYYTPDIKLSLKSKALSTGSSLSFTASQQSTPALFCGDTLFSAGCGRLFEGSPTQMYHSLQRLAALPNDTLVYCTHEYTLANLTFAQAVEPDNQAISTALNKCTQLRDKGEITLPSSITNEQMINPFLRTDQETVRQHLAQREPALTNESSDTEYFAHLRQWKDNF